MVIDKLRLQRAKNAPLDVQHVRWVLWMREDVGDKSTICFENKVLSLKLFSKCCGSLGQLISQGTGVLALGFPELNLVDLQDKRI